MIEIKAIPQKQVMVARISDRLAQSDWNALETAVSQAACHFEAFDVRIELVRLDEEEAATLRRQLEFAGSMQIGFSASSSSPTMTSGTVFRHFSLGRQTSCSVSQSNMDSRSTAPLPIDEAPPGRPVVHGAMADAIHPTRTGVGVRAQLQEVLGRR